MIRHIVLLTFQPATTGEQVDAVLEGLSGLPDAVPSLRGYSFTTDAGIDAGNADLVVIGDFDDVAGYEAYRDHPAHRAVITERILPILAGRTAVQIEIA